MQYEKLLPAVFVDRPNRFIARCRLGGEVVLAHMNNTGRLKELLLPGAKVYLLHSPAPARKTAYSLVLVQKGPHLVQIDSLAPNKLVHEGLVSGVITLPGFGKPDSIRREYTYGQSRFDLFVQNAGQRALIEVKGVTLEVDGHAFFPDAPTERGVKHLNHLAAAAQNGFAAYIIFAVQMQGVTAFSPNRATHPAFAAALENSVKKGVIPLAFGADVNCEKVALSYPIPITL